MFWAIIQGPQKRLQSPCVWLSNPSPEALCRHDSKDAIARSTIHLSRLGVNRRWRWDESIILGGIVDGSGLRIRIGRIHLLHRHSSLLGLLLAMTANAAAYNQQGDQTKEDHDRGQDPATHAVEETLCLAMPDAMAVGCAGDVGGTSENQAHMLQRIRRSVCVVCNNSFHCGNRIRCKLKKMDRGLAGKIERECTIEMQFRERIGCNIWEIPSKELIGRQAGP